jgi:hypothetical protein
MLIEKNMIDLWPQRERYRDRVRGREDSVRRDRDGIRG